MATLDSEHASADRLAAWAASFKSGAAPAGVVHEAKRCLLDVVGCALVGAVHPTSRRVRGHSEDLLSSGLCSTVFGTQTGPLAAAQINATAAHVWDYDDTCYEGIVHASTVVWPAVQAAVEEVGGSGETLISAFIAGLETEFAVARGIGPGLYERGWWNTGVLGAIGAAAGAGRALGLAATELSHAIRLAAAFASGLRVILGTSAKPFGAGLAARAGLEAALAARAGITGPSPVFEEHRGFAAVLNGDQFDTALLAIGGKWGLLDPGIAFKLYPACSAVQAAVEASLYLRNEHRLSAADIASVHCEVTHLIAISLTYANPTSVQEAQFSMQFAVACAMIHGRLAIDHLAETIIRAPETMTLMARVNMREVDDLVPAREERSDFPEAARVIVTMHDGRRFSHTVRAATGMPNNRAGDAWLSEKFRRNAAVGLSVPAVAALESKIWSMDKNLDASLLPLFDNSVRVPYGRHD